MEASPAPQSEFNPVRRAASPLQKLHDEILAFRDVVAPSSTERAAREDAFRTLERAAKSCWPRCEAKVFGSALTKLELPSSDVDVVVFGAPVDKGSGRSAGDVRRRSRRGCGRWRRTLARTSAIDAATRAAVPRGRRVRAHPPREICGRGVKYRGRRLF